MIYFLHYETIKANQFTRFDSTPILPTVPFPPLLTFFPFLVIPGSPPPQHMTGSPSSSYKLVQIFSSPRSPRPRLENSNLWERDSFDSHSLFTEPRRHFETLSWKKYRLKRDRPVGHHHHETTRGREGCILLRGTFLEGERRKQTTSPLSRFLLSF